MSVETDRRNAPLIEQTWDYTMPPRDEAQSNWDWCVKAADAIPPEAIVKALLVYLENRRRRRRCPTPVWSTIGAILGHGSGVSTAIVHKYLPEADKD